MVKGLDVYKDFFKGFEDNYILIGGAACYIHEELNAQRPRATKDLDVILVIEALSVDFIKRFWEFVKQGEYTERQVGENKDKHEYYRFQKPNQVNFPNQIELFSRKLEGISLSKDDHLTPIPADEELSSLSAILLEESYYNYVIEHSSIEEGVSLANIESLICLKAKAYIDLLERQNNGNISLTKHIKKHKDDIFRLVTMLSPNERYILPERLKSDIDCFIDLIKEDLPNSDFFKSVGLPNTKGETVFQQLLLIFNSYQ